MARSPLRGRRLRDATRDAALVLLCGAVALLGLVPLAPASADHHGPLVWGGYPSERAGEDEQAATRRLERDAGRRLGVVRDFLLWDQPFPEPYHVWLRDSGRTPILSVRAMRVGGRPVPWREIAAAKPGSPLYADMVRWADRMRAFGRPLYFSFNHEPETVVNLPMGVDSDFVAAWRRFHSVFVERGVTNARLMWIMTDYSFFAARTDRRWAPKWYPGDAYVDAIGADAYNWFTCREEYKSPWKSLEEIVEPFRDFGLQHPDEEMWLAEWATVEDPAEPGRKARWIRDARALFKRPGYAQFVGVSYFDSYKRAECPWPVETSPSSLRAWAAMGADPFYGGSGAFPADSIAFVGSAGTHARSATQTVAVPSAVRPGDRLLLFLAAGANPPRTTGPAGWTLLRSVDPSGMRGRVWTRVATAADAGAVVTVRHSGGVDADLVVAAYRSPGGTPVDVSATATRTTTSLEHRAPSVTPTGAGGWVVVHWADKSAANTGHAIPPALTRRRTATGTGAGHVTATLADSGSGVPAAPTTRYLATGTAAAGRSVSTTVALSVR